MWKLNSPEGEWQLRGAAELCQGGFKLDTCHVHFLDSSSPVPQNTFLRGADKVCVCFYCLRPYCLSLRQLSSACSRGYESSCWPPPRCISLPIWDIFLVQGQLDAPVGPQWHPYLKVSNTWVFISRVTLDLWKDGFRVMKELHLSNPQAAFMQVQEAIRKFMPDRSVILPISYRKPPTAALNWVSQSLSPS